MEALKKVSSQNSSSEVLFLLIIDFFSLISFWVTIPLSIFIILICKENIRKRGEIKFYKTVLILSSFFILLSISLQVAVIIGTGQLFGGIRYATDYFQVIGDKLSIVGDWLLWSDFLNYSPFLFFPWYFFHLVVEVR